MWKYVQHAIHFSRANSAFWTLLAALIAFAKNTPNLVKNSLGALPLRFLAAAVSAIGGQAVMEGVIMRNGDVCGLAVRRSNGKIYAQRFHWKSLFVKPWMRLPLLRGFPALLETLVNGIQALNRSTSLLENSDKRTGKASTILGVCLAVFMAVGLFIVAPHLLSSFIHGLGISGDVDSFSFHIWDGVFKCAIFIVYILLISFVPDIHRVFQYHGAEHKTVHAYEAGNLQTAVKMSRLHPRCGTTFILFVVITAILVQSLLVPVLLKSAGNSHLLGMLIKLGLVIPVSAIAYELILFAASRENGLLARLLQAPGLALQKLTTREPNSQQLEVAAVALAQTLDYTEIVDCAPYVYMDAATRDMEQI